jgi:hypothetical protein
MKRRMTTLPPMPPLVNDIVGIDEVGWNFDPTFAHRVIPTAVSLFPFPLRDGEVFGNPADNRPEDSHRNHAEPEKLRALPGHALIEQAIQGEAEDHEPETEPGDVFQGRFHEREYAMAFCHVQPCST